MSTHSPVLKRWVTKLVIAITIVAVGSMVGVLAITPRPAETEPAPAAAADEASLRRSTDAYAARYTGLAVHYAGSEAMRRGMVAYAVRYTGMAEHYAAQTDSSQRAMDAYAARLTGMAEHHLAAGE